MSLILNLHGQSAVSVAGYQLVTLIVLTRYIIPRKISLLTRGSVINRHRVKVVPQVNLGGNIRNSYLIDAVLTGIKILRGNRYLRQGIPERIILIRHARRAITHRNEGELARQLIPPVGFYTGNTQGIPLTGLQNSRGDSDLFLEIAVRNQALENALILFRIRCLQFTKRSHIIVRDLSLLIMLGQGELHGADILKTGTRQRHLNRLTGSNLLLRNSRNIIGDGGKDSLREVELHRQRRTDAVLSVPRVGVGIVYGAVGQNDLVLQVRRQAIRRNRQVIAETAVSSRFRGVKDKAAVIDLLVGVSVG